MKSLILFFFKYVHINFSFSGSLIGSTVFILDHLLYFLSLFLAHSGNIQNHLPSLNVPQTHVAHLNLYFGLAILSTSFRTKQKRGKVSVPVSFRLLNIKHTFHNTILSLPKASFSTISIIFIRVFLFLSKILFFFERCCGLCPFLLQFVPLTYYL
ncbi:MAG: hypothetical protein K0R50_1232 [Eubacterium sp.]|nr:hypothetical protein [Eubacterium sp.]